MHWNYKIPNLLDQKNEVDLYTALTYTPYRVVLLCRSFAAANWHVVPSLFPSYFYALILTEWCINESKISLGMKV